MIGVALAFSPYCYRQGAGALVALVMPNESQICIFHTVSHQINH